MSKLYIGPSIDASYQISDQLALRFQRRRLKCEKLRRRTPSDGKSSHCLWQGELTKGHNYVKASNHSFLVLHLQEEFMNDLD
jgi:hypothetical protein